MENRLYRLLLLVCAAISLGLVVYLLRYSGYGFDFTDEGYYLNVLANPWAYDWSVTQFAFVYHPLYIAFNGDIQSLRAFNIVLTFSLAAAVALVLLRNIGDPSESRFASLLLSLGLATTALVCFDSWLVTPNYNTLTLQGLLILSVGLVSGTLRAWAFLPVLVVSLGLYLVFLAKPTTAVLAASAVTCMVSLSGRTWWRTLLAIALLGVGFLVFGALLIDGSIFKHAQRSLVGVEFAQLLQGGHGLSTMLRLDSFELTKDERIASIVITAFIAVSTLLLTRSRTKLVPFWVACMCLMIVAAAYLSGPISPPSFVSLGTYRKLIITAVPAGVLSARVLSYRKDNAGCILPIFAISIVFLLMPWIYAFGTNGNYWRAAGSASIFWILGATTLLGLGAKERLNIRFVIPVACASVALALVLVKFGPTKPYRQPNVLALNDQRVVIGAPNSTLKLTRPYAEYIRSAATSAGESGFEAGLGIIDLTGNSPGLVYALGGKNLAQGWTIGGYPGSDDVAVAALLRVSCDEIASSWVLTEPEGPRRLSADILGKFGAELSRHYEQAGVWKAADGAGGFAVRGLQYLYKPVAKDTVRGLCEVARIDK